MTVSFAQTDAPVFYLCSVYTCDCDCGCGARSARYGRAAGTLPPGWQTVRTATDAQHLCAGCAEGRCGRSPGGSDPSP